MKEQLLSDYAEQIRPLLPLAKRAYGARTHVTPAHVASQEYTSLLISYHEQGGSLLAMAKELGVAYAGLRRRIVTADAPVPAYRGHSKTSPEELADSIERVKKAKASGTDAYHQQLLVEYEAGVSLGKLAKGLGLSGSNPLYYGVHRARALR
jgi:hypothetical protein